MRDGTILYADIYKPGTPGKYPVILTRTPYDRMAALTVAENPLITLA